MSLRSIAQKVLGMIAPEGEAEARAVVRLPRASHEQELQLWELLRRYPHTLKLTGAKLPPQPAPPVVLPPQPYFVDFIRDSFVLRVSEQQSEQINMIPKVKYDRKTNLYTVPFRLYPVLQLHKFVKATGLYYTDAAKERILAMYYEMRDRHKASMAHDAEIDMGLFGQALDPYQRAGIKGALRFKRGIIADAMGLGKTRQALGCFFLSEGYPWLVVSPASVSINWEKEAMEAVAECNALVPPGERFRVWRASSRKAPFHTCARSATQLTLFERVLIFDDNCRACQFETSHLILVTYGQIKDGWKCQYDENGKKIKGRKREKNEPAEIQLSPLATAIASLGLRGLIVDEFHKIKSEQAQQSKAVAALAVGAEYRYGLSGTPIKNRASELIFPLRVLDRLDDLGGEDIFHREFGESAPGDSRPYRRLHKMLRAIGYIRREKRDVRKELPPIRYAKVWVDIDNREEYARVEKDVVGWCAEQAVLKEEFQRMLGELSPDDQGEAIERKLIETRLRVMRAQALIRVGALKRVAARGKLTAAKEWIADFLENDKPLVVFVIHMTLYKDIQETFNCLHIRGADSIKNRQLHKEIFQRESANVLGLNDRMIICTNAAQEGINLDAADDIVQLELQWTPAEEDQIDARVDRHRAHNITSYKFVANETIEERIIAKLQSKRDIMEAVTSGRATGDISAIAKESVFDEVWADLAHYSMANHRSEFDVGARAKAELDEIRARAGSASPEEVAGDAEEAEATDAEFFEEAIQIGG